MHKTKSVSIISKLRALKADTNKILLDFECDWLHNASIIRRLPCDWLRGEKEEERMGRLFNWSVIGCSAQISCQSNSSLDLQCRETMASAGKCHPGVRLFITESAWWALCQNKILIDLIKESVSDSQCLLCVKPQHFLSFTGKDCEVRRCTSFLGCVRI